MTDPTPDPIVLAGIAEIEERFAVLRRAEAAKPDPLPAGPTPTEALLAEIRNELKARPTN